MKKQRQNFGFRLNIYTKIFIRNDDKSEHREQLICKFGSQSYNELARSVEQCTLKTLQKISRFTYWPAAAVKRGLRRAELIAAYA